MKSNESGFMLPRNLHQCRQLLARMDFALLFCMLVLLSVGVLTIYGAGQKAGGAFEHYWIRQLAGIGIGTVFFLACVLFDYRQLGREAWLFYGAALFLLVLVLVTGFTINRSRSWIPVLPGFTLQPGEIAKPATLFFLAWTASRPALRLTKASSLVPHLLVLGAPVALIMLQPDWGTALVFFGMAAPILFLAGFRWKWVAVILAVLVLAAVPAWLYVMRPVPAASTTPQHGLAGMMEHQRQRLHNRFTVFLDPDADAMGSGWNARQAMMAVGSGGAAGKGFMKGTQHELGFLPRTVAPTDFIFSVIGEENGFLGSVVILGAFLVIVLRCLRIASQADDEFGSYLAAGTAGLFFTHAYINVGMNIHAAPIIGIPLPLISYGGSFMISSLICLGLVQSIHARRQTF